MAPKHHPRMCRDDSVTPSHPHKSEKHIYEEVLELDFTSTWVNLFSFICFFFDIFRASSWPFLYLSNPEVESEINALSLYMSEGKYRRVSALISSFPK